MLPQGGWVACAHAAELAASWPHVGVTGDRHAGGGGSDWGANMPASESALVLLCGLRHGT